MQNPNLIAEIYQFKNKTQKVMSDDYRVNLNRKSVLSNSKQQRKLDSSHLIAKPNLRNMQHFSKENYKTRHNSSIPFSRENTANNKWSIRVMGWQLNSPIKVYKDYGFDKNLNWDNFDIHQRSDNLSMAQQSKFSVTFII